MMSRLLRAGADVDGGTQDGTTALMLAAYHGDVKSTRLLLAHGADPLRRNAQGYEAVQAAAQSGNGELAEMLREYVGESGMRYAADSRRVEL
jgi:ankyrin repeat protein